MRWEEVVDVADVRSWLDGRVEWVREPFPLSVDDLAPSDVWADHSGRWYVVLGCRPADRTGRRHLLLATGPTHKAWLTLHVDDEAWLLGTGDWSAGWRDPDNEGAQI